SSPSFSTKRLCRHLTRIPGFPFAAAPFACPFPRIVHPSNHLQLDLNVFGIYANRIGQKNEPRVPAFPLGKIYGPDHRKWCTAEATKTTKGKVARRLLRRSPRAKAEGAQNILRGAFVP